MHLGFASHRFTLKCYNRIILQLFTWVNAIVQPPHSEHHKSHRNNWLRATVLGANDGIVSTAALIVGVAASQPEPDAIYIAGLAGLVAGAMSMAAGEYVSVSSQADTERADLDIETRALKQHYEEEVEELAQIYQERGLDAALADQVARALMEHDALGAHARDEIGITDQQAANPIQAAWSSALAFSCGALVPLLTAFVCGDSTYLPVWVALSSLCSLAVLGVLSAKAGGANPIRAVVRVVFWGALAMLVTAGIGSLFDYWL